MIISKTPVHTAPRVRQGQNGSGRASARTPRILIIEDDADVLAGWSVFLRYQGYDVRWSTDGAEGLRAVQDGEPDAVLLDLGVPGVHGFEILDELLARRIDVPVIVVSASSDQDSVRRARQLGAREFLAKPLHPHTLVPAIERVLGD